MDGHLESIKSMPICNGKGDCVHMVVWVLCACECVDEWGSVWVGVSMCAYVPQTVKAEPDRTETLLRGRAVGGPLGVDKVDADLLVRMCVCVCLCVCWWVVSCVRACMCG